MLVPGNELLYSGRSWCVTLVPVQRGLHKTTVDDEVMGVSV